MTRLSSSIYIAEIGKLFSYSTIFAGTVTAGFSSITIFELWCGSMGAEEEDFYEGILFFLEEMVLSTNAAKRAGSWLRDLRPTEAERVIRDALIAAIAEERGEPVCTRNTRDFQRFPVKLLGY